MKSYAIVLCCLVFLPGTGCGNSDKEQTHGRVPDFSIVELQDTGNKEQKRFTLKIVLPSHYSENVVKSTLATISNTVNEPESELTIYFYGPDSDIRGPYDVARAVWNHGLSEMDYRPPSAAR